MKRPDFEILTQEVIFFGTQGLIVFTVQSMPNWTPKHKVYKGIEAVLFNKRENTFCLFAKQNYRYV